jgi:hypothetical protein
MHPKNLRELVVGRCLYVCQCGAEVRVQVCAGVSPRELEILTHVPAPEEIGCSLCDDKMRYESESIEWLAAPEPVDSLAPYLRVPSNQVANAFVAQYVERPTVEMPKDVDDIEKWGDEQWPD